MSEAQSVRVCINGFGRVGRAVFRHLLESHEFEVVRINEVNPDPANVAYSFNFDSIYGRAGPSHSLSVESSGDLLLGEGGRRIGLTAHNEVANLDVDDVDIVIDASGVSTNGYGVAKLLETNSGLVYVATHDHPDAEELVVVGANAHLVALDALRFVSSGICDANAIAPVLAVLNSQNKLISGHVTTVHPWLNYQNLSDGPSVSWSHPGTSYAHYPLGRAAIGNLIPKPTTAVDVSLRAAVGVEAPLGSFSYRVPTSVVSSASLVLNFQDSFRTRDLIGWLEAESARHAPHLFGFSSEPLVSSDFVGRNEAAIIDLRWTYVRDRMAHVVLWYDNEHGYAARTVEIVRILCRAKGKLA